MLHRPPVDMVSSSNASHSCNAPMLDEIREQGAEVCHCQKPAAHAAKHLSDTVRYGTWGLERQACCAREAAPAVTVDST